MNNKEDKNSLMIMKITLFILILGIAIVGKRQTTWPIITWSVYSTYSKGFPDSKTEALELRVYSKSSDLYVLNPSDIMPRGRVRISQEILQYAFESYNSNLTNENRVYLAQTIPRILKDIDIESIECWKLIWKVSPLSVPPLHREYPDKEILLGSFLIDDYLVTSSD